MSFPAKLIRGIYLLWFVFLLIVFFASFFTGNSFGRSNLYRLIPGAQRIGYVVCDFFEALGFDFSSIRMYYSELPSALWYDDGGMIAAAFVIVSTWAVATAIPTWLALWLLARFDRGGSMMPSVSAGDVVTQRILALTIVVFMVILFSPGWPAEGPAFRWLNDAMAEPARERQSVAITDELERQAQDWLPAELSPACGEVMTEGPEQAAARNDPSRLRMCGESVKSALEADATMGREPDPRTESASIRFLLEIAGLAKNGQLEGVGVADQQFREFERFARATYPNLRQEGWRQAAQRYLGLLQFPDERSNSQDARAETGYKLSVLAELLYNSNDEASLDVAYRIAAVTGSELECVPDALREAVNDQGTPVAVPDLPSCLSMVSFSEVSDSSFLGFGSTGTKVLLGLLLIFAIAIPFIPWPDKFPYLILYVPLVALMGLTALG